MWVRFNRELSKGEPKGGVVWAEDDDLAQQMIDSGLLTRCTGPDGKAFGEAFPEDVELQVKKEEKLKADKKKK